MIKFLLKGLIRDRSRSLFPVLMVAAGVFLTVFLYCWMNGAMDDLVSSNARFDTGHVKIMTRAYEKLQDEFPNDLALLGITKLLEQLRAEEGNMFWTPRIRFGGLLDIPDEHGETKTQGPVMGFGVDLLSPETQEIDILNLKKSLIEGNLPKNKDEILISDEFAKKLQVGIGGTATLISSTMSGSMAMYNFKIAGTVRFGLTAMDRCTIIADIKDVQYALDMADGAGEILGYSKDMMYNDKEMLEFARKFNEKHFKSNDEYLPVMLALSQQNALADYIYRASFFGYIIVSIFVLAMSLVLWNSGLMNGIRRYGEIGIRLAMGEAKGKLYRNMILESIAIGFIGSIIGTLLGVAVSYYLQWKGLDFGNVMQKSSMMLSNVIRARVTPWSYIIGFFPGLIAPVIGTMFSGIGIYKRQTSQLFKELEV